MSKKVVLAALTAAAVGLVVAPLPSAQAATPPALNYTPVANWWGTNGRVMSITPVGNTVFLAGGFDYVGPQTGYGTAVDGTGGVALANAPIVDGIVYASVPDGAGGWYIAGDFRHVGGVTRKNAARVSAAGVVDSKWNPKPNAPVYALAVSGTEVVFGGTFSQLGKTAVAANRIGATDLKTGTAVAGFSASADNSVRSLLAVGSSVYVGGDFANVDGQGRQRLAKINASNGSLDGSFTGQANSSVRSLAVSPDGTTVYGGGDFSQAFGGSWQNRSRLAAWATADGSLQSWAPTADASVQAVATDPASGTVYAGGLFSSVNGQARTRLAGIDTNGATTSWDASLNGCQTRHITGDAHSNPVCTPEVASLLSAGGTLYVGGRFGQSGTTSRHNVAAFNLASGSLTGWDPKASDRVLTLGGSGGNVFVGGEQTSVNGLVRAGVAALDMTTGAGIPGFTANTDDEVLATTVSPDGSTLYLGGHFQTVNGAARSNLAAVSTATGAVTGFKAQATDDVLSVAYAGGAVYASGQFKRINGVDALHAVKLDPLTGAVNPTFQVSTDGPTGPLRANGMVQSMTATPDGSKVFLAGPFNVVNGQSVTYGIVAVNGTTGAIISKLGGVENCGGGLGPWIVHLYLSPDNQRLYGGDVCPDRIYQWDAVNLTTIQNPTGLKWKGWCNGGMQGALEVNGNFYYGSHGGDKGSGGKCWASPTNHTNVVQSRYAVFDAISGALRPDSPQFSSPMGVWTFAAIPQGLLVGGDFAWAVNSNYVRQGLVLFNGTP